MALTEEQIRERVKALHEQHAQLNDDFRELDEICNTSGMRSETYDKYAKHLLQKHGDKLASQIESYFDGPKGDSDEEILQWVTDNYYAIRFFTSRNFYGFWHATPLGNAETYMHNASNIGTSFFEKYCPDLNIWGSNTRAEYENENDYRSWIKSSVKELAKRNAKFKEDDPHYAKLKNELKKLIPKKELKNEPKKDLNKQEEIKKFQEIFKKELFDEAGTYTETKQSSRSHTDKKLYVAIEHDDFWKQHGREAARAAVVLNEGPEGKDPWSMLKWVMQVRPLMFREKEIFAERSLNINEPYLELAKTWYNVFKSKQASETILSGLSDKEIVNNDAAAEYRSLNKKFSKLGIKAEKKNISEKEIAEIADPDKQKPIKIIFDEAPVTYNGENVSTESIRKLAATVRKGNSKDAFKAMMAAFDKAYAGENGLETGGFGRSFDQRMKMCDELTKTAKAYIAHKIPSSYAASQELEERSLKKSEKARVDFAKRLITIAKEKKKYLAEQKKIHNDYQSILEFADKCRDIVIKYNTVMNDPNSTQKQKEEFVTALLDRNEENDKTQTKMIRDGLMSIFSDHKNYGYLQNETYNKDMKATCDYYMSVGPIPKLLDTYLKCFREANKDNNEAANYNIFRALGFDEKTSDHYLTEQRTMKNDFNQTFTKRPEAKTGETVTNEKKESLLLGGMEETN